MTIDDKVKDEKLQYDIHREEAEISALSSGKFDKYEYLTDEEILVLIKAGKQKKLSLHILHQEKLLKNKEKQLKIKK